MQEHSLRLKNLISQAPEDAMLKTRRPVYKRLFKSNRVLRADQKNDVNQTCKQSVFSPMAADLSSDARTFIAAKKPHQPSTRRRHVKDQKTCLQAII